jgi:hypothetical protein
MNEQKTESVIDLRRTMSTLGAAEAELAWKKIAGRKLTGRAEITEALRSEVRAFRDAFIPANAAFTPEEWNRLYKEIDQAAARELSSSVGRAISDLESQRKEIDAEIIRQQTAIDQSYREFDRIKERAGKLHGDLEGFKATRAEIESAESDYKRIYEHRCKGHSFHPDAFFGLAEMMVTKPLRLEVLAKLEMGTKAAIAALQKRNKELAKELGLQPHAI